ncbi:MAG: hypothetical protein A2W31_10510 [Planctomycetes bacterium RBG_16_64_10]|nr:MAG: hypothetical protein A2W31_10510 [Planctomycetes bacterium RBG_16_64_10]
MAKATFPNHWLRCYQRRPAAQLRLLCFSYAGGGASVFRTWGEHLPEQVEVTAVQLPGREDRFREQPFRHLGKLVDALTPIVAEHADIPLAFFGHSMGGLIVFELTRNLRRTRGPMPKWLFISARWAPDLPDFLPPIIDLADSELVRELQDRYGGFPSAIAADPDLQALFLPIVRADLELIKSYVYRPELPLDCPISVYGGLGDAIARSSLAAWRAQTTAAFRLSMLPGDHFYVNAATAALVRLIATELTELWQARRHDET